jgi:hypothetical protein
MSRILYTPTSLLDPISLLQYSHLPHSINLEVPRLQLREHVRRVIFMMDGLQLRLVGWTIAREHVLCGGGVVLIDVSVSQVPAFCERDTAGDEVSCEFHDAVIVFDITPCEGDVDH